MQHTIELQEFKDNTTNKELNANQIHVWRRM